jgi:ribosome recycling factor
MISVANNTIKHYIENLNEAEQKELIKFLNTDEKELKVKFENLKENVVNKLNVIKESEKDSDVITRIDETIKTVSSEKYDKLNYFKLSDLNDNL